MQLFIAKGVFAVSFIFTFIAFIVCIVWIDRMKRKADHRAWGFHALLFLSLAILCVAFVGVWVQGNLLIGIDNLVFIFGTLFKYLFFVSLLFFYCSLLLWLHGLVNRTDRGKWGRRVFLFLGLSLMFGVVMAIIIQG